MERSVYFMQQTVKDNYGNFVPCIAVEGEKGYHRTDWHWGDDWDFANEVCDKKNLEAGYTPKEAMVIQLGTM